VGYLGKLLANNERVVRVSHDHWIVLLPTILIDVILGLIIVGLVIVTISFTLNPLPVLGLFFLLIPMAHFLFRLWVWWNRQYVITSQRLIQVRGMIRKRVSDTMLHKINDIVTEQSAMGRLLNYGDIEVIAGSDSGIDVFYRLADPVAFKKDLISQKASGGSQSVPVAAALGKSSRGSLNAGDIPDLITELVNLRKKGLLTEAEFQDKKRELLDRI
jgi:hypothetical protein